MTAGYPCPNMQGRKAPPMSPDTTDEPFEVHCPHCGERIGTRIRRPFNDRERRALQAMHNRKCAPAV